MHGAKVKIHWDIDGNPRVDIERYKAVEEKERR